MSETRRIVFAALESATGADVAPVIMAQLAKGEDVALSDFDFDSLTQFEVIMQIEEAFDIEIDADELADQETVHGLVAFVDRCRAAV